jgi:hypothetical protein
MLLFRLVSAVVAVMLVAYEFNQAGLWWALLTVGMFVVAAVVGHMSAR